MRPCTLLVYLFARVHGKNSNDLRHHFRAPTALTINQNNLAVPGSGTACSDVTFRNMAAAEESPKQMPKVACQLLIDGNESGKAVLLNRLGGPKKAEEKGVRLAIHGQVVL
jgi:hypothetical protein